MLDHFNLPVSNLEISTTFYTEILGALDLSILVRDADAVGFGKATWEFGIVKEAQEFAPIHLAFSCVSREEVDSFHRAALNAGGNDNGAPNVRTQYGEFYYSAYILDPDGHNVEAVCRKAV